MAKNHTINIYFFDKRNRNRNYMSRTAKTLKFKMRWFRNEGRYNETL